ncbi:unnamed protein product [Prunus brigantina]
MTQRCKDGFGESQAKKAETGGANSPKLPFGMEDVYAEGVEKVDFSMLRRQKKEVNLAMHR